MIDFALLSPLILSANAILLPRVPPEEGRLIAQLVNGRLSGAGRQQVQDRLNAVLVYVCEITFFVCAPYFVLTESSRLRGTVGKNMLHLKVTDMNGLRLRPGRAVKRYLSHLVSFMPAGYGFAMAGMSPRKQALHDYLAGTLVVIDDGQEGTEDSFGPVT